MHAHLTLRGQFRSSRLDAVRILGVELMLLPRMDQAVLGLDDVLGTCAFGQTSSRHSLVHVLALEPLSISVLEKRFLPPQFVVL